MARFGTPGGGQPAKSRSSAGALGGVSGVLGELSRTASTVEQVQRVSSSGGGTRLGVVASIAGVVTLLAASVGRLIGFSPEIRKYREQSDKHQLSQSRGRPRRLWT